MILIDYMAQVNLTKRALALTTGLQKVDSGIIDSYQGGKKVITVLCIIGFKNLDFIALRARLLIEVSRAANGLTIIIIFIRIEKNEKKRKRYIYSLLKHIIHIKSGVTTYQKTLSELTLIPYNPNAINIYWDFGTRSLAYKWIL